MRATKLQLKLFFEAGAAPEPDSVVPVFHDWIKQDALGEVLVDVAPYDHVPDGPAVLLTGYASDYVIDHDEGRPGLLYFRKREAPTDPGALFDDALARLFKAASLLAGDSRLSPRARFSTSELLIRVPDRLHAQNDDATFSELEPLLRGALRKLVGDGSFELSREGTVREPLTVRATIAGPPSFEALSSSAGR